MLLLFNKISEQGCSFNCLGNLIFYEKEGDIDNKFYNHLEITGIVNNLFERQKIVKKTGIQLYNTLGLSALLYGTENWTIKARDARRITAAELKYMRETAGYTWKRLYNKQRYCERTEYNPVLDKI